MLRNAPKAARRASSASCATMSRTGTAALQPLGQFGDRQALGRDGIKPRGHDRRGILRCILGDIRLDGRGGQALKGRLGQIFIGHRQGRTGHDQTFGRDDSILFRFGARRQWPAQCIGTAENVEAVEIATRKNGRAGGCIGMGIGATQRWRGVIDRGNTSPRQRGQF